MLRGGTMMGDDADGADAKIVDENLLKSLKDFDVNKILDKRFTELIPPERVVLTLFMINQQVTNIDNLV